MTIQPPTALAVDKLAKEIARRRTFAIISHPDAGKTTLTEKLLLYSGAIEQDADIVSFIYRPEYYQILEDEDGNSLKGIGEIIIAKHRNGALEDVRLKWDGQYALFSNLDESRKVSI